MTASVSIETTAGLLSAFGWAARICEAQAETCDSAMLNYELAGIEAAHAGRTTEFDDAFSARAYREGARDAAQILGETFRAAIARLDGTEPER